MKEIKAILAANCYIALKWFSYDSLSSNVWVIVVLSRMAYKINSFTFRSIPLYRKYTEMDLKWICLHRVSQIPMNGCVSCAKRFHKWVLNETKVYRYNRGIQNELIG